MNFWNIHKGKYSLIPDCFGTNTTILEKLLVEFQGKLPKKMLKKLSGELFKNFREIPGRIPGENLKDLAEEFPRNRETNMRWKNFQGALGEIPVDLL